MHDRIVHIKMLMAYSRSRDNIWKYGVKELKVILTLAWYISMNKSHWKRKMFFMLTHEIILIYYILLITYLYMSKIYIKLVNAIYVYMLHIMRRWFCHCHIGRNAKLIDIQLQDWHRQNALGFIGNKKRVFVFVAKQGHYKRAIKRQ